MDNKPSSKMNVVGETADIRIKSEFIVVEGDTFKNPSSAQTNQLIEVKCEFEAQTENVKIEPDCDAYANLELSLNQNKLTEVQTDVTSEPDLHQYIFDDVKGEEIKVKLLQEIDQPCFFDQLFNAKAIPGLTEYWGIHCCEPTSPPVKPCMVLVAEPKEPRCVIFSQVNIRRGVPVFEKQVVANDQLELKYFAGNRELNFAFPQTYTSLEELTSAINMFAKYKLCPGNLSSDDYEECESMTNSLYRDFTSKAWRHRYCNVFIHEDVQECLYCQGVPKYLRSLQRKSKTMKTKRASGELDGGVIVPCECSHEICKKKRKN